jgi:DNA-binding transcriptional LysR family regulator
MRAFVAVAEEASFSRAADRLHLVQSSVSASVLALEAELGTKLFVRGARRSALTDAGRALLPEVRRALEAVDLAYDAVQQVEAGLRGSVTLGVMQAQAMHPISVPHVLAGFRQDHPDVEVSVIHVGGSTEMARHVREGKLDLAVLGLPQSMLPELAVSPLVDEEMVVACAVDHPLAEMQEVALSALAGEPFADLPPGWGTRTVVDIAFAASESLRTVTFALNDTAAVVDFVRAGLAVAILPPSIIGDGGDIARVPIVPQPPVFHTQLVWPADRPSKAAAEALKERLISSVRPRKEK